jgi:glycosyltransferase involved in cell wall biosynthesis
MHGEGWKNIFGLFAFNLFILKQLLKNKNKITAIHACDFDTILPALLMKLFYQTTIIYDIFDWYVDSRNLGMLKYFVLLFEIAALKVADVTILCEEERINQLCCAPKRIWILPNIPNITYKSYPRIKTYDNTIKLSYVGVFAAHRGIEDILQYVQLHPDKYSIDIAGFGELENFVIGKADACNSIKYYGAVSYERGVQIMDNSDIIVAIYKTDIPNHRYAAPNKYYEGLFLGKPILTSKNTLVGMKTEEFQTGFVIGDTKDSICHFFDNIQICMIPILGENAKKHWVRAYSDYVNHFMAEKYLPFIVQS